MSDTSVSNKATEGTWAVSLLALAPSVAVRLFTGMSMPWLVIAWVFCTLSVVLVMVGWVVVFRHGARGAAGWGTCALAHAALAWQLAALGT
ncbi:MAG: hypothetical protein ACRDP3_03130 [Streptomyces sp.]|uniref:hypothetical protein n=1 Tax=Streptomyces sp. TaxID=1931 RepID=UPI003D6B2D93